MAKPGRWLQAVLAGLALAGTQAGAGDAVAIKVNPQVTYAPANLFVRARVEARAGNRRLEVSAESLNFYRSSEVQLDGEYAPRVLFFQLNGLPEGDYAVRATVRGADGREIARAEVTANVLGGAER